MPQIPLSRFRTSRRSLSYERRAVVVTPRLISDVRPLQPKPAAHQAIKRSGSKPAPARLKHSEVLMRQLVKPGTPTRRKKSLNVRGLALASLACALVIFGVGVGIMQLQTNEKVKAAAKTLSEQTDGSTESDVPSETPPEGGLGSYQVSSLSPRLISIPKIDVVARTLRLGVKPNNELKAPSNIFDAGWFEGSARPGEPGAMLVSGHVHGPTKPGVFTNLKKLVEGDRITIERGDGKKFNYRVVKVQSYDKDSVDMGAALNSAEPGKPGLNLITCDGAYDEDGHYKKRLIVFAVQE